MAGVTDATDMETLLMHPVFQGKAQTHPSTLHMDGTSPVVVHIQATNDELRAIHNKTVRLVVVDDIEISGRPQVCRGCNGEGTRGYPTSAGRTGGAGGMTITSDICNRCNGTGIEP